MGPLSLMYDKCMLDSSFLELAGCPGDFLDYPFLPSCLCMDKERLPFIENFEIAECNFHLCYPTDVSGINAPWSLYENLCSTLNDEPAWCCSWVCIVNCATWWSNVNGTRWLSYFFEWFFCYHRLAQSNQLYIVWFFLEVCCPYTILVEILISSILYQRRHQDVLAFRKSMSFWSAQLAWVKIIPGEQLLI